MTAPTRRGVYIAGPMSGYPDLNVPAFVAAKARLEADGWDVLSPVDIGQAVFGGEGSVPAADYLREDLRRMVDCRAIALLPGWEHSLGACCEVAVAITLGMDFLDATTGNLITRPASVLIARGYPTVGVAA